MRALLTTAAIALTAGIFAGCSNPADDAATYVKQGIAARQDARIETNDYEGQNKWRAFQIKEGRDPATVEELEESQGKLRVPPGKKWVIEGGALKLVDG
jgi:hypothetical protein